MNTWWVSVLMIMGMIAVTYGVRLAPFLAARMEMPRWFLNFLDKVPGAVLAALVSVPILEPTLTESYWWQPELFAALVALMLSFTGLQMLWTVLISMAFFWFMNSWL